MWAPRPERREMQALSPENASAFIELASGDRYEALYVLAISTGLRKGELLGLKWEDIDEEAGTLRVVRQLQRLRDGGGLQMTTPKGPKSIRTVRMSNRAIEALRAHRVRQNEEKLAAGALYQDQGLVFATSRGTPVEASNIDRRSYKPLLREAGLPEIRFHDLRHTFATIMLSGNTQPKVVQEMLGHSSISLTMDTYSHMMPDLQDQAVEVMNAALS